MGFSKKKTQVRKEKGSVLWRKKFSEEEKEEK
jgi:hypothetical protein